MGYLKAFLISLILLITPGEGLWGTSSRESVQESTQAESPPETSFAVRVLLGTPRTVQDTWTGSFRVENARLLEARGWELQSQDRFSLNSFRLNTYNTRQEAGVMKGFVLRGSAFQSGLVSVDTNQGSFSFPIADLPSGQPLVFLDGKAQVRGLLNVARLTKDSQEDDYPTIAVNGDQAWAAWQSFHGKSDEIRLAKYEGTWRTFTRVPGTSGDVWRPQVAVSRKRVWVVWSQQVNGNFDIYARALNEEINEWEALIRLSTHPHSDIDADLKVDRDGGLWVVWQGFRGGNSDVFLRYFDGRKWSEEVQVSDHPANDWTPQVAVDGRRQAYIVWDSYRNGNYDVYLRTYSEGRLGPLVAVVETNRFEAHPSVAVDNSGRLWVAWDEGAPNWGKDSGLTVEEGWDENLRETWDDFIDNPSRPGARLYEARTIKLVVFEGRQRKGPVAGLQEAMHRAGIVDYDYPQLVADPVSGRVALLFHRWDSPMKIDSLGFRSQIWEQAIIWAERDRWSPVVVLPESQGRPSIQGSAVFGQGQLWAVWPTDGRQYERTTRWPKGNIYATSIPLSAEASAPELGDWKAPPQMQAVTVHPNEEKEVKTIRDYRSFVHGVENRIVRGDFHRHGEFSWDSQGKIDGSLFDFYRYMIDAASMDFGSITDHYGGATYEYWWWLTEKSCDMYHLPGSYTSFYGYERSVKYPGGHRNVFHTRRGVPIISFFLDPGVEKPQPAVAADDQALVNDAELLHEALRSTGGISIPHTTATSMGTDWRYNDPGVEPVVEIFQGDRTSYETAGGPRALRSADQRPIGGFQEAGFVWNAYRKGYRIGTIASSDHWSTHISYAMVFTEEPTREAIFEAIKKRHTYGATDNIVLDVRMGDHFMGDEFDASEVPPLQIRIVGTSPVARVEVIKNENIIYTAAPDRQDVTVTFLDQEPTTGSSYYYVRLVQDDRQVAWGSPIWVNLSP